MHIIVIILLIFTRRL